MSRISTAVLDAMGFHNGLEIEATFHSVNIYSLVGVNCSPSALEHTAGETAAGNKYQLAFGYSVNGACQKLFGETLIDDELKWAEERSCTGPYLLIETRVSAVKRFGRGKDGGNSITTYDMFSAEKATLSNLEKEFLSRAVTAVSCLFQAVGYRCTARHRAREVFGLTSDSKLIRDIRFSFSGTGSYSRAAHEGAIRSVLEEAPSLANEVDHKVAAFIRLATDEQDPLKRFLFFFLAVEVEVHRTFGSIDHAVKVSGILETSLPNAAIATAFLKGQPDRLKTLKDRFTWCAIFAWPGMTIADIDEFARLKSVRDKISHGALTVPSSDAVVSVEELALKLQHYRVPAKTLLKLATSQA